jgi:hypothetical protein
VNGVLLHDRVEFLQLDALRSILFVLAGNVTAGTGQSTVLMLSAFHDYLYAISFFSHLLMLLLFTELDCLAFGAEFFYHGEKTIFIDGTDSIRRYFQRNPAVLFNQEEALYLQVGQEAALSLFVREGNFMTSYGFFTCYLTNASHDALHFFGTAKVGNKSKSRNKKLK